MEKNKQRTADELRKLLYTEKTQISEKGRLTAYQRVTALFDEGTFVEIGTFVKHSTTEYDEVSDNEFEGVVTGYGAIDGRLIFVFAQDFSRMKGAFSDAHAKKICNIYDLAIKNGSPIIGIFDSAGAKILEGVNALAGYGKIMKKASTASGVIPQIAIIAGICSGSSATIVGLFDIVIGVNQNGMIYVNPPFILKAEDANAVIGNIKAASQNGLVNLTCETEADAYPLTRKIINYIPSNNSDGTVCAMSNDEINRLTTDITSIISTDKYDMKSVLSSISDDNIFLELSDKYAPEILTGFIQLNSMVIGICASQPSVNEGIVTPQAAKKAAKFISFCDCFNIPLLTIVDTIGFDVTIKSENSPYSTDLAKLASSYAISTNAKVTVILGKAYGSAYTLLGSKSLGVDIAFAVDNAKISIMAPQSAINFVWDDKIKSSANPAKAKVDLENEWNTNMASPIVAAKNGEIDDIISCDELRQRISAAFEMLSAKSELKITKKHSNMPL